MDGFDDLEDAELEDVGAAEQQLHAMNESLGFQDFGDDDDGGGAAAAAPRDDADLEEQPRRGLLDSDSPKGAPAMAAENASMFSVDYYKRYFDVSTSQVGRRLLRSLNPSKPFFPDDDAKPDLYGPFWIATTLIFLMGAMGNFADYLATDEDRWTYDFEKVTTAASVLYSAISIVPLGVFFALQRMGTSRSLVSVVSLYGYSLFVFVPTCVLCVLPSEMLRWLFVLASYAYSVRFIVKNLWKPFQVSDQHKNFSIGLLVAITLVNGAYALLLKMYFFKFPM